MSTAVTFDSDEAAEHFFVVSDRINVIAEMLVWIRFREFSAPARSASASGELTSNSGGGSTSGASSAASSSGGGSSTPTTSNQAAHRHLMFGKGATSPIASGDHYEWVGRDSGASTTVVYFRSSAGFHKDLYTFTADGSHDHTVTIGSHTHGIEHTHSTPNHQHTTPTHGHDLDYGIFKEAMPGSWSVNLGIYRKPFTGGAWTLLASVSGLSDEEESLELTELLARVDLVSGLWRVTLQSAAGQPNNGRLTADIAGQVLGAIASI